MKVLHISFHNGCINDLKYVLNSLNIENDYLFIGEDELGNQRYNITSDRAKYFWNKYRNIFEQYDCIITSDTAPLCRIFIENDWNKKLIVWICNRFDYYNSPVHYGPFPDINYYNMMRSLKYKSNVHVIGYTAFENYYCKYMRNVDIGDNVIKPCGGHSTLNNYQNNIDNTIDNSNTIFIPPYHNDTKMMNLANKVRELGFNSETRKYNGPADVATYKAVVHIPYAWSNLACFESFPYGIVYFIPSKNFIIHMIKTCNNFWFQDINNNLDNIELSEWYDKEHSNIFIYFDSWEHLQYLIKNTDYKLQKQIILEFYDKHKNKVINQWKAILSN